MKKTGINVEICYTNQELIKGASNILDETMYSIVVFKIHAFFVLFTEELPNESTSEDFELFKSKILFLMLRILFMRIDLPSAEKEQ